MSLAAAARVATIVELLRPYLRSRLGIIVSAFVVVGIVLFAFGANPLRIYYEMFLGAFGSVNAVAETLVYTTPILFTGLAAIVCFRCGMWNVGAEGQLYLGALAAVGLGFN